MNDSAVDFAIFGSTPLARLLASLLASAHGKKVVWLGDSHAAFRLPRSLDLSIGPMTRPKSWALLSQCVPETVKLIARAGGKAGMTRLDPIFFANTPMSRQALAFVRSSATSFGQTIERVPLNHQSEARDGILLRDAIVLHRDLMESILDRWLDALDIMRLSPTHAQISIAPDGGATIAVADVIVRATCTVLADDEAILAHLPPQTMAGLFTRQQMTTILTEPTFPMAGRVMLQLDAALSLLQGKHRGVTAIAAGDHDVCVSHIGALLGAKRQLRQAGGTSHERLNTPDGAAIVGRMSGTGPQLLAGLGPTGAFLAPALARWLAGAAKPNEAAYFAARNPDRSMASSHVSEFVPLAPVRTIT